jgi:gamma-glutamyltranspeptidase/glutathione hydrolase
LYTSYSESATIIVDDRTRDQPLTFTTRPELSGHHGMVASTHWLASGAGMAMLERGGNAFDAAVAAGLVLQVVEPHLNGPGGDSSALAWSAAQGRPFVVCGQGAVPARASVGLLRDELGLDIVPGTGLLPACVPGAWLLMLRDHGTATVREAFALAIEYAAAGFPVLPRIAQAITSVSTLFTEAWPTSAELWLDGGAAPAAGGRLRNPLLAATYDRLVCDAERSSGDRDAQIEHVRAAWRTGWIAEAILDFTERSEVLDASGRHHHGLLDAADLAAGAASFEEPVTFDYRGYTVCKTGPWAQGPVFLAQLAQLEGYDLAAMGRGTADFVHTVVEGAKLAFADREAYYGDGAPGGVPLDALLSPEYAAARRGLIGPDASRELRPGAPDGRVPRLPTFPDGSALPLGGQGTGEPTRGDTCHVSVADRFGNLVAVTPSGGWLQSSPAIPGLGFCLGTRGQMTWLQEGLASSLVGGRRPRSTLSPTLALRDGAPYLAFGTPGGDQQDQWSLLLFLSHIDFGLNLQEAIDAPAFHTTHFPDSFAPRAAHPGAIEIESRFAAQTIDELRRRGHDVTVTEPWSLGRLCAVSRAPDGVLRAAANPRGMQGYAVGR